jgi:ribosomal RNA-processing protein 8
MSAKLFKESDSWGESSGQGGAISWSFKKTSKKKDKKIKKAKKRSHSETEDDPNAGKFVRAPKYYGLEDSESSLQESPSKEKRKKLKRKHEQAAPTTNGSSPDERAVPKKKLKEQPPVPTQSQPEDDDRPVSYQEKLRESLKGSRFRFLNEQMYKQSGKESMKLFQEDETAFEAYHEGYRLQIAQWPMNPLDRIINGIKRL